MSGGTAEILKQCLVDVEVVTWCSVVCADQLMTLGECALLQMFT